MSDTHLAPAPKAKTPQQVLADLAADTAAEVKKEITVRVNDWANRELANVAKDVRGLVIEKLIEKADFADDGAFIVPSKKSPTRTPLEYVSQKWPSILQKAETPNGALEMESAMRACQSITVQGEMVKAIGVQRLSELMSLVGGKVGHISKPIPIQADAKGGKLDMSPNNPFSAAGWSLTKQGALVRAIGAEKAAGIAAAVGAKLGDLRPNKNFIK